MLSNFFGKLYAETVPATGIIKADRGSENPAFPGGRRFRTPLLFLALNWFASEGPDIGKVSHISRAGSDLNYISCWLPHQTLQILNQAHNPLGRSDATIGAKDAGCGR